MFGYILSVGLIKRRLQNSFSVAESRLVFRDIEQLLGGHLFFFFF